MDSATYSRSLRGVAIVALALVALTVPALAGASTKPVAKEHRISSLGETVLTTSGGHTLYSLSVEQRGRFICTNSACLALWHPLVVRPGTKPTGPVALSTVKRPDGRIQVTYRGLPLYVFDRDMNPGEANGEGFKDVGTWHAASVSG